VGIILPLDRILLTGFDPFGGQRTNPALEAVSRLHGRVLSVNGWTIELHAAGLQTVFGACATQLVTLLQDVKPVAVIAVGQAGGRSGVTPERVAINVDDARIPDNEGHQPIDQPVVKGGATAYWSTLPIKRIVQSIRDAGIPATVSNTAGTFVCNHLFYHLMHCVHSMQNPIRAGFIHVPYLPEQVTDSSVPSMPIEDIVLALEIAAQVTADTREDIVLADGREC
jgi:pyroglutamyl-peptidase